MLRFGTVTVDAPPGAVWPLLARPERWHEWSPYVRGGERLGEPEVEEGAVGSIVMRSGLRIAAEILEVVPGRSWAWRVKGLVIRHEVAATPRGTRLSITPEGDGPLWAPLALAYRLPTALIARNVARIAGRD
jgi:uncharacterized protein YndB with AHSA1/START domain